MSFSAIYSISGSAMNAQTIRLNTVASNLANMNSAASTPEEVYKVRYPVFEAIYNPTGSDQRLSPGVGVNVVDVVTQDDRVIRRYEPHHPLADNDGYVFYPDMNVVEGMADMMSASRNFETNIEVLNNLKSMQQSLLKLGE